MTSLELPLAPYLYWAKTRQPAAIDLAGSNLLHCTMEDLPGVLEALQLTAPNDNGFAPLVEAIAAHYEIDPRRVMSADGCSGANFLTIAALVEPGDDVLIERPGYDPLIGACRLMRATVRRFERRFEDGFAIDLDHLRAQLTPRTRLIVVSNPHNPSGTLLRPDAVAALGLVAGTVGATVLVDEVYLDGASLAADEPPTAASAARLAGPFVVTNSLTKSYGLAGLRNGWVIASPAIAERIRRVRDVVDNANSAPSDRLARLAFSEMPRLAERTRAILGRNLRAARTFFSVHPALEIAHPPVSSVVFPRLRGKADAEPFVQRLLDAYGVAVAPGRFFERPEHFRISLAGRSDSLESGLARISEALDALVSGPRPTAKGPS